jgi:putative oligomerization/nucleic acid binding protein
MFMRRRRPLARAAMVGGAAYYAGKRVQEGREDDAYRDARLDQLEAQQAPAPQGGGMSDNAIEQLQKLGQLHDQGVLTDAEFEVQKQKVLQGL